MEVIKHLHMNEGTGETSYSSNSIVQERGITIPKPVIKEAILDVISRYTIIPKSIGIADMGCSSGPSSILVVSYLIDTIYTKCNESDHATPEFFVFLNDLPGNDFNTIFKSLQGFYDEHKKTKGDGFGQCFIAGVPGTFYGRLFPSDTLQFVHSSYSLHWLSQVPPEIGQSNKGNIYLAESSPSNVLEAYLRQFKRDFSVFLRSRSEEVVGGGRMVLSFLGRTSEDPCFKECCYFWELFALSLKDMVSQGMIEEEKLDSFNLPVYFPSPQEVKLIIQKEGSFTINHLETIQVNWNGEVGDVVIDNVKSSHNVASCIRAVFESLLVSHFGPEMIDELFRKYREIIANCTSKEKLEYTKLIISMTRGSICGPKQINK